MTRTILVLASLLSLLALAGCSSLSVDSDWDSAVDFNSMKTFSILERPSGLEGNQLVWRRIQDAIRLSLEARAYTENTTSPDFLVAVHLDVADKVSVQTYNYGYGSYYNWHSRDVSVSQYQEGTLVIDFVDGSERELFWRGWGTKVLDGRSHDEAKIQQVVDKIISQYPPK